MRQQYQHIDDDWQLADVLHREGEVHRCAFQGVNLTAETELALSHTYADCLFLGCTLPRGFKAMTRDCLFFPRMGVVWDTFPPTLYTAERLYEGYTPGQPLTYASSFDGRVYRHYMKAGKYATDIKETLARTLHDHSISDALHDFLALYPPRRIVGVMGGHALLRTEPQYERIVRVSKRLTERGFLMISGGGPGAMEATHLGAWMAGRTAEETADALDVLRRVPAFDGVGDWLDTAFEVRRRYPQTDFRSLGLPTWLYGHEPATPLATHIAKYFDNSIREDGILTIAMGGIIYTPGSAGTLQEIFQEAVQNHYLSLGFASPMIFTGVDYWTRRVPVYPLLQKLIDNGVYKNLMLTLTDDDDAIVGTLEQFAKSTE